MTQSSNVDKDTIDAALANCRQGDCVVGEHWFVRRFSPDSPLTETAACVPQGKTDLAEDPVAGFAILTQTCDIVRPCNDRPFLEIAPLVEVDDQDLKLIKRGHRPRYAYVPGVSDNRLVVDLDSVMTIEKALAAEWSRIPGCNSDDEVKRFAQAIARKRVRFAFPDDFSVLVKQLHSRLQEKHDKQSVEGEALRSLREIRVQASPSWDSDKVEIMFWFIRDENAEDFDGMAWNELIDKWLKLVPEKGRFKTIDMVVMALEELTARDYVDSVALDLDHMSTRPE